MYLLYVGILLGLVISLVSAKPEYKQLCGCSFQDCAEKSSNVSPTTTRNATATSNDTCSPISDCDVELPNRIVIPFGNKSDKYLYEYKEKVFTDDVGSTSDNQVVWVWWSELVKWMMMLRCV